LDDILLSPLNIGFLITFGILYLVVAKKQLRKRN